MVIVGSCSAGVVCVLIIGEGVRVQFSEREMIDTE